MFVLDSLQQNDHLGVARRAFVALPSNVTEYYFRGDSACYEAELIRWLRDEKRAEGPQGRIGFAVSVRLFPSLKKHIERLPIPRGSPTGKIATPTASALTC